MRHAFNILKSLSCTVKVTVSVSVKSLVGRQKYEHNCRKFREVIPAYDVVIMRVVVFDEAAGCIPAASVQYT